MWRIVLALMVTWACPVNSVCLVIKEHLSVAPVMTAVCFVNVTVTPACVTSIQEFVVTVKITPKGSVVSDAFLGIMEMQHKEQAAIVKNVHALSLMELISSVQHVSLILMDKLHVTRVLLAILEDAVNRVMMDIMVSQKCLAAAARRVHVVVTSTWLTMVTATMQLVNV